eukprot:6203589-Pleurochrysis_carterae.AAC.5
MQRIKQPPCRERAHAGGRLARGMSSTRRVMVLASIALDLSARSMEKTAAKAANLPSEHKATEEDAAASLLYNAAIGLAFVLVGSLLVLMLARGKGIVTRMPNPLSR